ncbi:MAG TPA: glutamine--tRNA ligase/YqeY domain fusion protein [Candidatus Sabulitectum sp.]|nr:glutamine--tRNA ligase/YqeY domain fusion protein [Candidatus Sabulitectum sp.]HPJ28689.1 glutamine--tRNA ligase/YqeY domain fusion protein [Candidatus Sabulitectum sp.]HPR22843.1 glutamine--tRNA ligase/YqeY domain fusion protein [Candidatus Sabulitectum sp.]
MEEKRKTDFIRDIIESDLASGKHSEIITRFPPEPNGYLHIGHAKSICTNFGIAEEYRGRCNLRFDDTNPVKEETEFVEGMKEDIRWLGFQWDELHYASDYFQKMYELAVRLIEMGLAYVCDLSAEEIRNYRGTLTEPGKNSPYRDRSVEENLDLFRRMKEGEFPAGSRTLRAKIDMASPNMNMRDPAIYRIVHHSHHRTGDSWRIYPMYDFAHCLEDSIERVTHSLCTLEFEDNRPLYDWYLEKLDMFRSRQIEFARLNLNYTVVSKRYLRRLVEENFVDGWDDPRMPTLCGMRRRGIPPEAIRKFCSVIGLAKRNSTVDIALFESCIRDELNAKAPRVMSVIDPVRLVVENYPEDRTESFDYTVNPEDESQGIRKVPFTRELYIERGDFMEDPPRKYHRMGPGREVRLRYAYLVTCTGFEKDENGRITEIRCVYDPESSGGNAPDGRKVRGTIHWISSENAREAEVRLYDRLFAQENPLKTEEGGDFTDSLNPDSLKVARGCLVEEHMVSRPGGYTCQFERHGYFCVDPESTPERPVFNRTITLKDSWARQQKR